MKGGERKCAECIHGPTQRECDVYHQANKTFAWLPYGSMYCEFMERKPIPERIGSTARRWASEMLGHEGKRGDV